MLQMYDQKLNIFAEFADPALEAEFLQDYMKNSAHFIGPIGLVCAIVYMLFGIADFQAVKDPFSLTLILTMRALFLLLAVVLFGRIHKSTQYNRFCGWVTAFEVLAVLSFLVILHLYASISFLSYLSVLSITLAIYIVPGRLRNAQAVALSFTLVFFLFFYSRLEPLPAPLGVLIFYDLLFLAMGNVSAYVANLYKRRQFLDSRALLKMYLTDPLTGIANRVKFDQDLERWIAYCSRYDEPLSLVLMDIDDFKKVNDSLGHLNGDRTVQSITLLFREMIRGSDVFARWGGDEFALLLPGIDIRQATEAARRLKTALGSHKIEKTGFVTCSFGLAALQKGEDAHAFLLRADQMLYLAKDQGKNAIAWADDENQISYIT